MLNDLNMDKAALRHTLSAVYGLRIANLTFIPQGEVTYGYRAEGDDGTSYFIKVYGESRAARISAARLPYTLSLSRVLHDSGLLPNVAYPLRARNGWLRGGFMGQPLVVYPYIDGRTLSEEEYTTEPILSQLAALLVQLHQATSKLNMALPKEDFSAPFEGDLLACLEQLRQVAGQHTPGQRQLRELILPREQAVRDRLERLHALGQWATALNPALVLCHTDMHRFNLICDEQGALHLLDWENAMLAPREHDLKMFTGQPFEAFLEAYVRLGGPAHLEPDLFSFYFHHRNLEDLTDWLYRILNENESEEQDEADLAGIRGDCLQWWDDLDAGDALRAIIARHGD